jgi:LmbE family N-acetylglucosaminyl deacetylase
MNNVLCIVAHPDDEIVGMGGTILKYLAEGQQVSTIIFSYGEKSHPHIKEKIMAKTRVGETKILDEMLNRESIFLGLTEGKIEEESKTLDVVKKLAKLIREYNPKKIFTHTSGDPHRDHRAVNQVVEDVTRKIRYKGELLTFEVWNIVKENLPAVYVDITPYFDRKMELMKVYESQKLSLYALLAPINLRARMYGRKNNCKYAERFYKLR